MLTIDQYTDYRLYLKDLFNAYKESKPGFSYRSFAKAANLSSPSFLKLVMDGKRNLTDESIDKFIIGLQIPSRDAEIFRTLVKFNQAKSNDEKIRNYRVLQQLKAGGLEDQLSQFPEQSYWSKLFDLTLKKVQEQGHSQDVRDSIGKKLLEIEALLQGQAQTQAEKKDFQELQ